MARVEYFIAKNWGRTGTNLYGYGDAARGIPFSLSMRSGGDSMEDDEGSKKYFMQMKDFDCAPISYGIITAMMVNQKLVRYTPNGLPEIQPLLHVVRTDVA